MKGLNIVKSTPPLLFQEGVALRKIPVDLAYFRNFTYYLPATILTIKEATMLMAITSMIIVQALNGVQMGAAIIIIFTIFDLVILSCLFLIMKNIAEPIKTEHKIKPRVYQALILA